MNPSDKAKEKDLAKDAAPIMADGVTTSAAAKV